MSLRLLLVEDSTDDVVLLVRALARVGLAADPVRVDCIDALKSALASESFDAVICDYVLPQLDAVRALSLVRERARTLPCIVLSGQLTPAAIAAARQAGAIACLEKDDIDGLATALRGIVSPLAEAVAGAAEIVAHEGNELGRFFSLSLDCLCIAGFDGYFKRVNPAFERVLGHSSEALLGRPFMDFVHPDDRSATRSVMKQLRTGRLRVGFENRYQCANDSYRWLEWTAFPVLHDELIYAVARDVTERKALEDALRRSADEVRDLYNQAPCGYHSLDADGVFVEINDTELSWLGYRRDEVIGRKCFADLLPPSSADSFQENFPRFKEAGTVSNLEFELRRKDGALLPVLLNAVAVRDADGKYLKSRTTVFDITARKAVERRLSELNDTLIRRTAEVEAINEELDAFSYSASHDLRAPLRAIEGFTSIVLDDWPPPDLDAAFAQLQRVRLAATRMRALVDDLLKLSQVGRGAFHWQPVDLSQIAGEVVAELRAREPARNVDVVIAPDVVVTGDPSALRLVMENMLDNAWKFTRRQTAARVEFGAGEEDGESYCFVRDNGAGFDASHVGKLFTAFQRLHMASEFEGTGIGLTIVRRVIHLHGGRVWAEGAVGRGAKFSFSLPQAR